MTISPVHVAVGIIMNEAGQVLIARRSSDVHLGGLWEFPGGKIEPGESCEQALRREVHEETGIEVRNSRPLIRLNYRYPDRRIVLDVRLIHHWEGKPRGREGQPVRWVSVHDLPGVEFPPANEAIIRALQLPSLYLISPGPMGKLEQFYTDIDACTRAGAKLLQLRCRQKLYSEQPEVIETVLAICESNGARLLLNTSPSTAVSFQAHGVHLNSARLLQLNERPLDSRYWVSASCHNRMELDQASRLELDFVVISPVMKTRSHPEATPLGWECFSELTGKANMPVYALGGMQPAHIQTAWKNGAQGVAMLGSIWEAADPASVVRKCDR